jgi:hypothetical protein
MDFHEVLKIAGGVGTLLMFIPMAIQIVRRGVVGQSISTWLLWSVLDSILAISTILRHGNYLLPLGYAIGGWALTALLLAKSKFVWTRLDNVILGLVVICLVGWKIGGAHTAIICATLATSLATIPGLVELWRHPQRTIGNIWLGYALTNALSFFGGTATTIEERFTPAIFAALSLLMVVASRKEMFIKHRGKLDSTDSNR